MTSVRNIFEKLIVVFLYLFVGALFLYAPKLKEHFFPDNTLRVYSFTEFISTEALEIFEKKYGINVRVKYFDTNEELLAKFKISKGEGYDIITPSDYMVELLRKEELLHALDHSKLPVISELDNRLLSCFFDLGNKYSIPLVWSPYGIVFNKNIFDKVPDTISLNMLFEKNMSIKYSLGMINNSREAISLAALYAYGVTKNLDDLKLAKIKKLLLDQKKNVETYLSEDLSYFLYSNVIDVALTPAAYVKKLFFVSEQFGFKIPHEGSLLTIENLAIPAKSKKIEQAHVFINFLLSREIQTLHAKMYGFNPSNKTAYTYLEKKFTQNRNFFPDDQMFGKLHILRNNVPVQKLEEIWLEVKSS